MTITVFLNILYTLLLVVFFLGGSIFVHELGHFLAARWRGLKIKRFSIGFPPNLFSREYKGIKYIIGAIPLGGYVALPQLSGVELIEGEAQTDEEPLPPVSTTDKIIVASAGAFFNVLFALLLATVLWFVGEPTFKSLESARVGNVITEMETTEGKMVPGPAYQAGLKPDDIILQVDKRPVQNWEELLFAIISGAGRTEDKQPLTQLTVQRGDRVFDLDVKPLLHGAENIRRIGIFPYIPVEVGRIFENSPMEKAGILTGDIIIAINEQRIFSVQEIKDFLQQNEDQPVRLKLERNGESLVKTVTPERTAMDDSGKEAFLLGFTQARPRMTIVYKNPFSQIYDHVQITLRTLGALINRNTDIQLNQMSGPIGIADAFYQLSQAGIRYLLSLVVLLNINLAILNLLPIPVLDGGHIFFAIISKIRGKAVPIRLISTIQGIFVILLMTLMAYIMFHDILRVSRNIKERKAINEEIKNNKEKSVLPVFEKDKNSP